MVSAYCGCGVDVRLELLENCKCAYSEGFVLFAALGGGSNVGAGVRVGVQLWCFVLAAEFLHVRFVSALLWIGVICR